MTRAGVARRSAAGAAVPRARLREVAARVGVHPSTVSRVLNPATRHLVSSEMARRVSEAALALGYRPDAIASSLRTRRSLTIAVIIPDITNPLFPPVVRGIEDALGAEGYTAIVANAGYDAEREGELIETMTARGVDGFVLATARRHDPVVERHAGAGLPLVLVNRRTERADVAAVFGDDAQGIRLVVRHLAALGHRRIAHVAGPAAMSTGHERHEAFLAAMAEGGLAADPLLVAAAARFDIAEGRAALLRILDADRAPTAVVAANDLLALGCYDALAERGLACPGDVSVTGYNDMPYVDKVSPPLTTVRIDAYEMGAEAARALVTQLRDGRAPREQVRLGPTLVIRGSTAAAKAAP
jgi:LacI family transcriptional regulator